MTTLLSPTVNDLFNLIHRYEPRAVDSGSVPNLETEQSHSYHRSWQDSPHDDGYSVHYFGDRVRAVLIGRSQFASALDVSFGSDEVLMEKYTARFRWLARTVQNAYWSYGLREAAGTLNGTSVWAYDYTSHSETGSEWSLSHLSHIHLSFNRRFVNSSRILKIASLFN